MEGYIRDAVFHQLIPLPVEMDNVQRENLETPLDTDHSTLSNLKKTLDSFSQKHGFTVKQLYRTTSNAKWACRPKLKAMQSDDEKTECTFYINGNVRKFGGVFITSMNLNHNHPLHSDEFPGGNIPSPTISQDSIFPPDSNLRGIKRPSESPITTPHETDDSTTTSWARNLLRNHQPSSGFWGNARWYDLHLNRRLPLVPKMLEQMILALPPISESHRVADLCAGSGACTEQLLQAYPDTEVVLFDASKDRLEMAVKRLSTSKSCRLLYLNADLNAISILKKAPYDVIIASLAVHVLVERPSHYATDNTPRRDAEADHKRIFQLIFNSLRPNGHIIIGDHVGLAPLFSQMKWMEAIGFVDVDCSWRQDDFFVMGARRPSIHA